MGSRPHTLFLFVVGFWVTSFATTRSDLHRLLQSGEVDYDTYTSLIHALQNGLDPCGDLDLLLALPEITSDDLYTISRDCNANPLTQLQAIARESVAPFLRRFNPLQKTRIRVYYTFERDLKETLYVQSREHTVTGQLTHHIGSWHMRAENTALGEQRLSDHRAELRLLDARLRFEAGTFFNPHALGLNDGGVGRHAPISLHTTFLQGNTQYFATYHPDASRSAGLSYYWKGFRFGVVGAQSQLKGDKRWHPFSVGGLSLSSQKNNSEIKAEAAFTKVGESIALTLLQSWRKHRMGINLYRYSDDFLNPTGRGRTPFYARKHKVVMGDDTISAVGLRRGEENIRLFGRLKMGRLTIAPDISHAHSRIFQSTRKSGTLSEAWTLSPRKWRLRLRQTVRQSVDQKDTTHTFLGTGRIERRFGARIRLSLLHRSYWIEHEAWQHSDGVELRWEESPYRFRISPRLHWPNVHESDLLIDGGFHISGRATAAIHLLLVPDGHSPHIETFGFSTSIRI